MNQTVLTKQRHGDDDVDDDLEIDLDEKDIDLLPTDRATQGPTINDRKLRQSVNVHQIKSQPNQNIDFNKRQIITIKQYKK